jgi:outer membrane lipoprotein-sorting protein
MMKRLSAIVALALLSVSVAQAGADSGNDPALALLSQALAAPSTVSYSGVVQCVRFGNRAAEASVYRIEHRAPNLTRRTYTAPAAYSGDSEITQGGVKYAIDPTRHRVVETRSDATEDRLAMDDNAALIRENYRAVEQGVQAFDGRRTVGVSLINRYSGRRTMFVRIDVERKLVLDKQEYSDDGSLISEIRFESVTYSTLPAADFAVPKTYGVVKAARLDESSRDADRIVRDAGFGARKPRTLPEGFSPLDGALIEMGGARTVHLLYSDGVRTLSLFESATPVAPNIAPFHPQSVSLGGRSAQYGEDGSVDLLTWTDGRLYYTLVGELGITELASIARKITP